MKLNRLWLVLIYLKRVNILHSHIKIIHYLKHTHRTYIKVQYALFSGEHPVVFDNYN